MHRSTTASLVSLMPERARWVMMGRFTRVALASLYSVELEFLAMADQANCTFVGVASSK